jgi:phosphatidylinositol-bisphosphatase
LDGGFNSRVNGSREDVEFLVREDILGPLLANDQLNLERKAGNVAADFTEGKIEFVPSYRFDPGTNRFDSSRKRRIPGWTDRIL